MRIIVKVKPNAKEKKFEKTDCSLMVGGQSLPDRCFVASVNRPAKEGKANEALIKLAAGYFKTSPSSVKIIAGAKARNKILEIE